MKSDNDSLDKALRNSLQQKLGNFELAPSPPTDEKLLKSLKTLSGNPRRGSLYNGLALLIVGVLIGLWMFPATNLPEAPALSPAQETAERVELTAANRSRKTEKPAEASPTPFIHTESSRSSLHTPLETRIVEAGTGSIRERDNPPQYPGIPLPVRREIPVQLKPPVVRPVRSPGENSCCINDRQADNDPPTMPGRKTPGTSFLFSLTGINTFQKLIVMPQHDARLQNFDMPASFRNPGFNVEAGIEKKGLQLMVGFSRFDQTFSYEIAKEGYSVLPDEQGNFVAKREGAPVTEYTRFRLLGISLKKQAYFRAPALNSFYGQAGISLYHDLASSNNSGWIQAGVGKSTRVSRSMTFSAGPYAGYSLGKMTGANDAFRFRPFQVGVTTSLKLLQD